MVMFLLIDISKSLNMLQEGTDRYAGFLPAPAEGFEHGFCLPLGQKKPFMLFLVFISNLTNF